MSKLVHCFGNNKNKSLFLKESSVISLANFFGEVCPWYYMLVHLFVLSVCSLTHTLICLIDYNDEIDS